MIIEVSNIGFAYAGAATIFSNLSFSVSRGRKCIFLVGVGDYNINFILI